MRIIGRSDLGDGARAGAGAAPVSALETELARIWHELLGGGPVGGGDHFFERGGNSLGVMRLAARLEERYGVAVPLAALFAAPTLAGMASALAAALHAGPESAAGPLRSLGPTDWGSGDAPLSLTQERMWLLHQLAEGGTAYSVSGVGRVTGPLSAQAVADSLRAVVQRHEALRTTFVQVEGQLRQRVGPAAFELERVDLRAWPEAEREARAAQLLKAAVARPFDFQRGPMFRAGLYRLDTEHHLLLLDLPHLNSDAWSLGVLVDEFLRGYAASVAGQELALPPLDVQYRDYAVWQREWLRGETLERLRAYWLPQLRGLGPLALPLDHPRPPMLTFHGATVSWPLPDALMERLRDLARRENATLFMLMLTVFKVLLRRWTGVTDVAVGTPVAGRQTPGTETLIGVFVNTLVLRTDLGGQPTFRDALARVRATAVQAFDHQHLPFAQLVADLHPARDLSRSPLVSVMFNHINVPMPALELAGTQLSAVEFDRGGAQFDLSATVTELPGDERLTLEYNTALFERQTALTLLRRFAALLHAVAADPEQAVDTLPLLLAGERRQLLAWGGEPGEPPEGTVHGRFEEQVRRTPERPALLCGDHALSYHDLNVRANRLARRLRARGLQSGEVVAVYLPRSAEAVVAILAVLKAGGAYLPLDPATPPARLEALLHDARPALILRGPAQPLPSGVTVPTLTLTPGDVGAESGDDLGLALQGDALAYVLYTSGSTGRPKGVEGTHRGVLYRAEWMWAAYPFHDGEVCCLKTSLGFVDSVWELFGPLLAGTALLIVPDDVVKDPPALIGELARARVTRVVLVPSLLGVVLDALPADVATPLPELRLWSVSGEALSRDLARRFARALPHARLLNLYGSTEVAGDATVQEAVQEAAQEAAQDMEGPDDAALVPIGRPLTGAQVYVVDSAFQLVPPGTPGELLVGGHGLARGYHRRPELTAGRFIPNPFGPGRVYRTHDLATWTPGGRLRWLGRTDRQLKIRGVRVEPEEIEAALLRHPQVQACAVTALESVRQEPQLVAYVVRRAPVEPAELRTFLAGHLPAAFVPAHIVPLEALPLTPSGKLDRPRLPPPPERPATPLTAPATPLDRQLAALWAEVLDLDAASVGLHDHFFELGGHSLLAARLIARIEREMGVRLPLTALFQAPTVAALGQQLRAAGQPGAAPAILPFHHGGRRPPLFWLGHLSCLWHLTGVFGPDQPVYGLNALSDPERAALGSVEAMAAHYLTVIREVQPTGPYFLVGYSFGGLIMYDLARQLQGAGEEVRWLALLDTVPPTPAQRTPLLPRAVARHLRWEWQDATRQPRQYLAKTVQRARKVWARLRPRQVQPAPVPLDDLPELAPVTAVTLRAAALYRAAPLAVPTLYLRARQRGLIEPLYAWEDVLRGPLHTHLLDGDHTTMLRPERLGILGAILDAGLRAAQSPEQELAPHAPT